MLTICLNKQESKIISLSKMNNNEELLGWTIPNVLFPLLVIIFSLFAYGVLTPKENFEWLTFFNLLVNGSILMAAFNRMSSMIAYSSKIEFVDAQKLGINLKNVKMKILTYSFFLVLGIAIVYSYQVINKPFDTSYKIIFQILISALFFWFAIDATKIAFLLQEAFLKNTYELSFRAQIESLTKTPDSNDIKF